MQFNVAVHTDTMAITFRRLTNRTIIFIDQNTILVERNFLQIFRLQFGGRHQVSSWRCTCTFHEVCQRAIQQTIRYHLLSVCYVCPHAICYTISLTFDGFPKKKHQIAKMTIYGETEMCQWNIRTHTHALDNLHVSDFAKSFGCYKHDRSFVRQNFYFSFSVAPIVSVKEPVLTADEWNKYWKFLDKQTHIRTHIRSIPTDNTFHSSDLWLSDWLHNTTLQRTVVFGFFSYLAFSLSLILSLSSSFSLSLSRSSLIVVHRSRFHVRYHT